ncbi:MAG TPA: hypothetical protein VEW95_06530 [Candidatus Limnocylindrales bacterium]|nr:hypothetical protein [Candidatus Limnocylindrales bacterium]
MPLADGDWICQSCWKANRSHDPLCYRCRTPRGIDPKRPGEVQSVSVRGDQLIPRVLVSLPAAFLRIYVLLNLVNLAPLLVYFLASLTTIGRENAGWPVHPVIFTSAALILFLGLSWGIWQAALAITRRERWGYVVGLVMTAPIALAAFLLMAIVPGLDEVEWLPLVAWGEVAFYGVLAVLSLLALAASFTRRDVQVTPH